jgi:serine/threonine-protein kinase
VQVFDMGRYKETYFLAMEFIDGMSLFALLRDLGRAGLPLQAVTFIAAELASALEYLHQRTSASGEPLRLVHRDLNPPNVLLSRIGEVKLSDFGIVRTRFGGAVTVPGSVRGKAGYMAPEQAKGMHIDGRTDLFALGLSMHEALTGEPTLEGDTDIKLMRASFEQDIHPPSRLRLDVPPALDALVMKLLAREVEDRVQSAAELRRMLAALPPECAPYPEGRAVLTSALQTVLARPKVRRTTGEEFYLGPTVLSPKETQAATLPATKARNG